VLSCVGRGLCDGLITRPEESYRVSVCVWSRNPERGPMFQVGNLKENEWMNDSRWIQQHLYWLNIVMTCLMPVCGWTALSDFVVNSLQSPALYSGGLISNFGPRQPAVVIEGFTGFLSTSGRMPEYTLKLGHDLFLPTPFQFIIIHSSSYYQDVVFPFRYGLNS
jgi:hypothetical protein